jgi:hypothetical protein
VTALPPPDDLAADLLRLYRTAPPGRQATVDQYAADLRASLARLGLPATPPVTMALFVGLAIGVTLAGLDPDHPNATVAADLLVAAAHLTRTPGRPSGAGW